MKILFKYATRSRPELFKRGLLSIVDNCEDKNYCIAIAADYDDKTMKTDEINAFVRSNSKFWNMPIIWGKSDSKVHAINRGVDQSYYHGGDWDILVCMSDDMVFTERGFDETIRESFNQIAGDDPGGNVYSESNLDQCLHFPDGNRKDLITMSIMGRDYYKRFNYIYNPEYKSLYCDNEQTEVAKILGCYKYVDKQIFEHLHPAYGKAVFDAQYQHTESFGEEDRQTYIRRKEANFGL